jgi:uncharacterized membrane protein
VNWPCYKSNHYFSLTKPIFDGKITGMQSLVRVILWLKKTDWGLSFLLALASLVAVVAIATRRPGGRVGALFGGPVFRAGFYFGTIVFPNYATRGTNGFYLAPLCGLAANFLVLMAFWFIVIRAVDRLRTDKQDLQQF